MMKTGVYFSICLLTLKLCLASPCLIGQQLNQNGKCEECPPGYFSSNGLECKRCKVCRVRLGLFTSQNCSAGRDTTCLCKKEKYINMNHHICTLCTTCHPGFFQLRSCAHNRDRKCKACHPSYTTNTTNAKSCYLKVKDKREIRHHESSSKTQFISIGISLVVAISILIAFIVVFIRRQKKFKRKNKRNSRNVENDTCTKMNMVPLLPDNERDITRLLPEDENRENHRKVRDLPANIYEELGAKLNPDGANNWVTVAGNLNFSMDQISFFKLEPKTAMQDMLLDWSTTQNSTVVRLYNVFVLMGRDDCLDILEQYVYGSG